MQSFATGCSDGIQIEIQIDVYSTCTEHEYKHWKRGTSSLVISICLSDMYPPTTRPVSPSVSVSAFLCPSVCFLSFFFDGLDRLSSLLSLFLSVLKTPIVPSANGTCEGKVPQAAVFPFFSSPQTYLTAAGFQVSCSNLEKCCGGAEGKLALREKSEWQWESDRQRRFFSTYLLYE